MNLIINNLAKSYNGTKLFHLKELTLSQGTIYCLTGASGSGKTTFLRILLGLETGDQGTLAVIPEGKLKFSAVFQENRLCETFSPVDNIMMIAKGSEDRNAVIDELSQILPVECLNRPISTLSGGMKRRVAICRAMFAASDAVLMDEPFTGLDEDTKLMVIRYIKSCRRGRMLIVSTHQPQDIELLGAKELHLAEGNFV